MVLSGCLSTALSASRGWTVVVGAGKAAASMAEALGALAGSLSGLVVAPYGRAFS